MKHRIKTLTYGILYLAAVIGLVWLFAMIGETQ